MASEDDEPDIEGILNAVDEFFGVVRNNQDVITGIIGGASSDVSKLGMSDGEPLKKMYKSDEKIEVVVEVPEDSLDSIGFTPVDEGVDIEAGEKVYRAMVPNDVDLRDAEVTFNNGVLTVEIPRKQDETLEAEVVQKEITLEEAEEDEEESEEDNGGED